MSASALSSLRIPDAERPVARGFTLLELLVVLVIVAIITSFAVLGLGSRPATAVQEERQRLTSLVDLARDEALLEGRNYGVGFWREGYAFFELRDGEWAPLGSDEALRERIWPEGLEASLLLERLDVALRADPPERPQVFLFASGEMTPFELRLQLQGQPDTELSLRRDLLGRPITTEH
ncbi:MAG: type II secretion system minor pseudopilin GspH [Thiotrichales bacterium]